MEITESEVQKFYSGKTVFITGGSGFIGKLLVEKLLRSCEDLKRIYLLMREKKGKSPEERMEDIFNVPAFDVLKKDQPNFSSKIFILDGELERPDLGLSDSSKSVIREEVNCIFHVGATVRFNEKLRKAAHINVRATRDLLRLAKEMKGLNSYVHVSTIYSNCARKRIDEVFYEPVITGDKLFQVMDCMDDKLLDDVTLALIHDSPNTYVFTKRIAEDVMRRESTGLPVVILRPSIVTSTYFEPIPGWIDNFYGPVGLHAAAALGVLRTVYGNKKNRTDFVPVDFLVNAIIVSGWKVADTSASTVEGLGNGAVREPKIYNYVSGPRNPITWGEYVELAWEFGTKCPLSMAVWYPMCSFHNNYVWHSILAFLFHVLPAYVADFVAKLLGKEAKYVALVRKLEMFSAVITYFTTHEWDFSDGNVRGLWKQLNATDKKLFNFDISALDWRRYGEVGSMGGRIYLLKDPVDTIPWGVRKLKILKMAHYTLVALVYLLIFKLLLMLWNLF